MPYQIIYSSESATPMQEDELQEILEQARSSNAKKGIAGALIYVDGVFLQVLEGEMQAVQDLMAKIAKDFRHETVTVLRQGSIERAAFSGWDMAYVSATPKQVAEWAGLSETTAIPEVLDDMRQDARRATQVTESILALLERRP